MLGLSTVEVAQILGLAPDLEEQPVRRVVIDSRVVAPGDLFVALVGARTDGHQHLRQAQAQGAVAALVMPDRGERPSGFPCLVVRDTLKALAVLARAHLARLSPTVVGITGSVGKTTAKDFLYQLLGGAQADICAAPASYNSEVGLPLAILSAPLSTKVLVLEYGINAPGEMDVLLSVARPHHAWITALGASHLEGLGSVQAVCAEKSKLAQAADANGHLWLTPKCARQLELWQHLWSARLHQFADFQQDLEHHAEGWVLQHPLWGSLQFSLPAAHEVLCALQAAEIAVALGASADAVRSRFAHLCAPPGRMSLCQSQGMVFLDDAYNANPLSMQAALQVLAQWPQAGRRIAVLGSMKELGSQAQTLHQEIGRQVAAWGFDFVLGVGSGGAWIVEECANSCPTRVVDDAHGAASILQNFLAPGDVVLLKASRSEALERILSLLQVKPTKERLK